MTTLTTALLPAYPSCGTVVSTDGRSLPLRTTRLAVRAAAGLAQVRLVQTFQNPHAETLHVTYQLPMPADAAVGGFEFRLGELRVVGDIDRTAAARERFEQAIASGRTASLLEQDRTSMFRQEIGNLPAGAELEATIEIDQPLYFVDGCWQWRFPTTLAPRYLGSGSDVPDAARVAVDVIDPAGSPPPPRCELDLVIGDTLTGQQAPQSMSHTLQVTAEANSQRVAFAAPAGRVPMDRDVVVQWPVAAPATGVTLRTVRLEHGPLAGQAFGLLTLVPPRADTTPRRLQRDLIVLLDVSGSMRGAPLAQAQQVTAELIRSLEPQDRLELIAFASKPQPWSAEPQFASETNKAAALAWLLRLQSGGGTEMHTAILAALAASRAGTQRQVVVVTDGQIGFEQQIVASIRNSLPSHSRVHVVGIGSAPNRTLTRGASRAGRGIEVLLGIDEHPAVAARRLLDRTAAPLTDELTIGGSAVLACAPQALPDLFAASPMRVLLRLQPDGGTLHIGGASADGVFRHDLTVRPIQVGGDAAIARSFGREAVEDLEVELAATGAAASIDARIEALGLAHRIATRLTSWIAVTDAATVDPRSATRRELVPQELPHGMSIAQLGLRRCIGAFAPHGMNADATVMSLRPGTAMGALGEVDMIARRSMPAPPTPPSESAPKSLPPASPPPKASFLQRLFGARPSAPRAAHAKLRLRNATEWVFEIVGLPAWVLPRIVALVFADGSTLELTVDVKRTTAAGSLATGALVRLVLVALPGAPAAAPIRLRLGTDAAKLELPIS